MKLTKGLDPFLCEFHTGDQLVGDAQPKRQDLRVKGPGVVRAHLEGSRYFTEMFKFIEDKGGSIWKDDIAFKFMLAPISAQPHYEELHGNSHEKFYNLLIQARMYHLWKLSTANGGFTLDELKAEFKETTLAEYMRPDRLSELLPELAEEIKDKRE